MTTIKLGTDIATKKIVYIDQADRRQQAYVIGATGTGKSSLLLSMILQDIDQAQNVGLTLLDAKGDLVDAVIERVPRHRVKDIILLQPDDRLYAFGLNLYECPSNNPLDMQDRVEQVMAIFNLLYDIDRDNPLISQTLRNASYTLIANHLTFAELPRLLQEPPYRNQLLQNITDPYVRLYWKQFEQKGKLDRDREIDATTNKFNEILQPKTRGIVGQLTSTVPLNMIFDARPGKIVLVKFNLQNKFMTSLIGSLLVANIVKATYARQATPQKQRKQHNIYVDEFSYVATPDFENLFDQARGLGVTVLACHQQRTQLTVNHPVLAQSVMQAGTIISFRIPNTPDAQEISGNVDTTPPPPPMQQSGTRAIQTPRSDVLDWLLAGKTHGDPAVDDFINNWGVREIQKLLKKTDSAYSPYARQFLDALNEVCFKAMLYQTSSVSIGILLVNLVSTFQKEIFGTYENGNGFSHFIKSFATNPKWQMNLLQFITFLDNASQDVLLERDMYKQGLLNSLEGVVRRTHQKIPAIGTFMTEAMAYYFTTPPYDNTGWFFIDEHALQWEEEKTVDYSSKQTVIQYKLVFGQQVNWYTQISLEHEIDRIMALGRNEITNARSCLFDFFSDVATMLQVLTTAKIEDNSGRQEVIYSPGPQQSHADRKSEIANMLSSPTALPQFTAYVRLSKNLPINPEKECLNCKAKNRPTATFCASCGKRMIGQGEYKITLIPSTGQTYNLPQTIADITKQNLADGYIRLRSDVEAEIIARNQPPPPPAAPVANPAPQPKTPSPQSPTPPPPLPAKRGKAQQKICSNCQTSNPVTSVFCSACGTRL